MEARNMVGNIERGQRMLEGEGERFFPPSKQELEITRSHNEVSLRSPTPPWKPMIPRGTMPHAQLRIALQQAQSGRKLPQK